VSITAAPTRPAESPTILRHCVLAALLVITTVNYAQRNAIAPAATTIEEDLGVTSPQLDLAAGAFFLAYTLLQVPSGWLAQRWGPRLMLALYAAGWSLAVIACARASGFFELYIGRLAMGALQAGIFPCATLILQVWYPSTQRGIATALLNSFMLLGSAGGVVLAGHLLGPLGWRGVFLAYAVPGIVWAVWFLWWFRNSPAEHPGVNQAELSIITEGQTLPAAVPPPTLPALTAKHDDATPRLAPVFSAPSIPDVKQRSPILLALCSLPLILLCTQQCFRAAANRLFDSRLPTYLERQRGLSKADAATLSSYPQWAGIFGGIFGGALSDYILRRTGERRLARKGLSLVSLTLATAVYLSAWFIADTTWAMLVFSAGAFLFCASSPCSYALCIDIGGKHLAIVFGLMNMMGNLGAFAFVSSVTSLVRLGGWELALGVWLMLHVAAFFCWLFLDPDVTIGETASPRLAESSP
jgi:ACS family glucarate transporter-like MFS transporter